MKSTTILIAAVLTLQTTYLFADNNIYSAPVRSESPSMFYSSFAPTTPAEATFEEAVILDEFAYLAPVAPIEAQFEDLSIEMVAVSDLAPITPAIADFEDGINAIAIDYEQLAPVVPAEADFE